MGQLPGMSSRLRECDATRQHTMTATRMTMFEPLAAARPAVGSSRSLWGRSREPHSKGAGRIITKAKRRELVGTLARRMRGLELICTVKAKHALLGPARPRQTKKEGELCAVCFEAAITVARGKYSILRQYFRGGTYRSRHVPTGRVVFAGVAKSFRKDDVVERALRAQELLEHFFVVVDRVAYDVLDGTVAEGPRLVTDNGPSTVA